MTTILVRTKPVKNSEGKIGLECLFYDDNPDNTPFFKDTYWEE